MAVLNESMVTGVESTPAPPRLAQSKRLDGYFAADSITRQVETVNEENNAPTPQIRQNFNFSILN